MDPLSITVSALSIAQICGTVGFELAKFIKEDGLVDTAVAALQNDVKGFETVLAVLNHTLNDPKVRAWIISNGRTDTYWHSLTISLDDAKGTLYALEEIVTNLNRSTNILNKTRKQLRLKFATDQIAMYRQQIGSFRDTVQIILNTTSIWHQASDDQISDKIVPRLDETEQMIRKLGLQLNERMALLQDQLNSHTSATTSTESLVATGNAEYQKLDNLRNCLKGAATVITSASTAMGRRVADSSSTIYGSDFGDVFPSAPSELTLNWIEENMIAESDEGYATTSEISQAMAHVQFKTPSPPPDFDEELELEMMQACYERGMKHLDDKDLEEAERYLQNCIDGLNDSEATNRKSPELSSLAVDAITALVPVLKQLEKWEQMQEMLKKKLSLLSRTQIQDENTQLEDKLLLSEALYGCVNYKEALLYCRSAEMGYRKQGAQGVKGRVEALGFIAKIFEHTDRQKEAERCIALIHHISSGKVARNNVHKTRSPPSVHPPAQVTKTEDAPVETSTVTTMATDPIIPKAATMGLVTNNEKPLFEKRRSSFFNFPSTMTGKKGKAVPTAEELVVPAVEELVEIEPIGAPVSYGNAIQANGDVHNDEGRWIGYLSEGRNSQSKLIGATVDSNGTVWLNGNAITWAKVELAKGRSFKEIKRGFAAPAGDQGNNQVRTISPASSDLGPTPPSSKLLKGPISYGTRIGENGDIFNDDGRWIGYIDQSDVRKLGHGATVDDNGIIWNNGRAAPSIIAYLAKGCSFDEIGKGHRRPPLPSWAR